MDAQITWERYTGSIPHNAVIGGSEYGKNLYVVRSMHNDSYHPGKLVDTHCNIGWGGKEITEKQNFEVLVALPAPTEPVLITSLYDLRKGGTFKLVNLHDDTA